MRYKLGQKAVIDKLVEIKKADKENFTLEAVFSTQDVDRHGDTVRQGGWSLDSFRRNPVIINSHNYGDATEVIGRMEDLEVVGKKLVGRVRFAVNENPKAKVIFDLYANGFLNAFSVGFIPLKFREKGGEVDWSFIEESELLEVSAVSVPANARALAKRKGIEVDALGDAEPTEEELEEPIEPVEAEGEEDAEAVAEVEELVEAELERPAEPEPEPADATKRLLSAVESLNSLERTRLSKANAIIGTMLKDGAPAVRRDRLINQAVRELLKAKER